MTTVTISSKGQITLPARLRKLAGLGLREPVVVAAEGDHLVVRKAGNILNWRGALGKGKPGTKGPGLQFIFYRSGHSTSSRCKSLISYTPKGNGFRSPTLQPVEP